MIVGSFLLVWSLGLPAQASAPSPAQAKPQPSGCAQALAGAEADAAAGEICSGDEAARLANAASKDGAEKTRHLEAAAEHYRKAALLTSNAATKFLALNLLVDSYDAQRLNDPKRMERRCGKSSSSRRTTSRRYARRVTALHKQDLQAQPQTAGGPAAAGIKGVVDAAALNALFFPLERELVLMIAGHRAGGGGHRHGTARGDGRQLC